MANENVLTAIQVRAQTFFEVEHEEFVVYYLWSGYNTISGTVHPISRWTKLGTGEVGWSYDSSKSSDTTDDEEQAKILFHYSFCWRGVWEGRIYFPDGEEYWSEDLAIIAAVWTKIEAEMKVHIRAVNPDNVKWMVD